MNCKCCIFAQRMLNIAPSRARFQHIRGCINKKNYKAYEKELTYMDYVRPDGYCQLHR